MKDNFLKLELKDIGLISPIKFSKIIVNDIKLDFSINLNPIKSERKNIINKDKSFEIKRNINNNNNNNFIYIKQIYGFNNKERNKTPDEKNFKIYFADKIKSDNKIIIKQKTI